MINADETIESRQSKLKNALATLSEASYEILQVMIPSDKSLIDIYKETLHAANLDVRVFLNFR
jgi:hypothetical protein